MTGVFGAAPQTFKSVRLHRNYRLYYAGQMVNLSGSWMQDTALPWLILGLTHSPFAVGLLAACRYIPFTFFGLFAGTIADRFDNRRFLMINQGVQMANAAAIATLVITDSVRPVEVYVVAAVGGMATLVEAPTRHTFTFQLVGRDELPNAVALNSGLFNLARTAGPAIAGAIIAVAGVGACFVINAASFLAILAALMLMRPAEFFALNRDAGRPTPLRGIGEAIRYIGASPDISRILIVTTVITAVAFNFHVSLPLLARETLQADAVVFGIISGCLGAGALVGSLATAARGRVSWQAFLFGTGGFGAAMLATAPQRNVVVVAALLFLVGLFFAVWNNNASTMLQLSTPDRLRGRVVGIYIFSLTGFVPIGSLLTGWLVDVGGTRLAFLVGGGMTVAATFWAMRARGRTPVHVPDPTGRTPPQNEETSP